jgi:hypothetical protein
MTASTTEDRPTWKAKKKKGEARPAPAVILNGSNVDQYFPPPKRKVGAPSTYSEKMVDQICEWLSEGKSLLAFCEQEGTPDYHTVRDWRRARPEFDARYMRAKDEGLDAYAENLIKRSVDVPAELANARKLEIDTGKWYLSKIAHRRYGDRLDVKTELTGPNGGPLQLDIQAVLLSPESLARLDEAEVAVLRSAIAKLMAPTPVVIDGEAVEVTPSETPTEE